MQDVWLGPAPQRDAGEPAGVDGGEPDGQTAQDGGDADADAGEPEDAESDAGDELDAGAVRFTFCGLEACTMVHVAPCIPDEACWLTEEGNCAKRCHPAPVCGIGDARCDDPDTFCNFVDGQCNATGQGGYCTPRPVLCNVTLSPVCDCLGTRHESECAAAFLGMPIRLHARCD